MQAVANGCQIMSLEESMPECAAAASFAATAALSGYALTIVSTSASCTTTLLRVCVVALCISSRVGAGDREWEALQCWHMEAAEPARQRPIAVQAAVQSARTGIPLGSSGGRPSTL